MKKIIFLFGVLIGVNNQCESQSSTNTNAWASGNFIGWDAGTSNNLEIRTSNLPRITVSGTSSNIGIGVTPSSTFMLDVSGSTNSTLYGIGGNTVLHNPGTNNMFTGVGTGASLTTGLENVFNGFNAGNANTSGNNNMFAGSRAGLRNTSGANNLFCGTSAGNINLDGSFNVYLGALAGQQNVHGDSNVVIGDRAGSTFQSDATVLIGFNCCN